MSIWYKQEVFFSPITQASRFKNIRGESPKLFNVIDGSRIVLSKEDLTENTWLFIYNTEEEKLMAEQQIKLLIFSKNCTIILEN